MSYFTTIDDWQQEIYNPNIGIADPENNAYVVQILTTFVGGLFDGRYDYNTNNFKLLIEDARINELQALIIQFDFYSPVHPEDVSSPFTLAEELICAAKSLLPNLKQLSISDIRTYNPYDPREPIYSSRINISDLQALLAAFPNLELIKISGFTNYPTSVIQGIHHDKLKTLIFETNHLTDDKGFNQICCLDLPNLEYFKLSAHHEIEPDCLSLILSGLFFPKLKYLGLCYFTNTRQIIDIILKSLGSLDLAILDVEGGYMVDEDITELVHNDFIQNLKMLNISRNCLSSEGMNLMRRLNLKVKTTNQYDINYQRYWVSVE